MSEINLSTFKPRFFSHEFLEKAPEWGIREVKQQTPDVNEKVVKADWKQNVIVRSIASFIAMECIFYIGAVYNTALAAAKISAYGFGKYIINYETMLGKNREEYLSEASKHAICLLFDTALTFSNTAIIAISLVYGLFPNVVEYVNETINDNLIGKQNVSAEDIQKVTTEIKDKIQSEVVSTATKSLADRAWSAVRPTDNNYPDNNYPAVSGVRV